jgi:hypothetical protein
VARPAAQPRLLGQGLRARLHIAAIHHSDRALDLRVEVDALARLASDRLAFARCWVNVTRELIPTSPSLPPCSGSSRNGLEMMSVVNDLTDGHP